LFFKRNKIGCPRELRTQAVTQYVCSGLRVWPDIGALEEK
jgi:hypothetical protein